jgi:CRISPR-associated protein Cas8b1/Cst1 subtype I-B
MDSQREAKNKTKPKTDAVLSFRIPLKLAEFLEEEATKSNNGSSKMSKHKIARKLFVKGLKEEYGIDMA